MPTSAEIPGWLLRTAAEGNADYVEAVMRGYREHVQLTDEELDRLSGVLNMRPLWLGCIDYRASSHPGADLGIVAPAAVADRQ